MMELLFFFVQDAFMLLQTNKGGENQSVDSAVAAPNMSLQIMFGLYVSRAVSFLAWKDKENMRIPPCFCIGLYSQSLLEPNKKKNKGKVHLWLYRPQHPYTSRQVAFHFSWVWSKLMCLFISCSCRLDSTACREAESEPSVIMRCRLPERPSCTSSSMTSSSTRTAAAAASGVCTGPGGSPRTKR